jgi:hypothetical protein
MSMLTALAAAPDGIVSTDIYARCAPDMATRAAMSSCGNLLNVAARRGLVERAGVASGKGSPLVWRITDKGRQALRTGTPAHAERHRRLRASERRCISFGDARTVLLTIDTRCFLDLPESTVLSLVQIIQGIEALASERDAPGRTPAR